MDRSLAAAGALGPFFRVDDHPSPDWTSWAALSTDPKALRFRTEEVHAALAAWKPVPDIEPAVVASLTHLGLVARLVSPLLGAALLSGVLPVTPVENVHVHLTGANPLPLALSATSAVAVGSAEELADALHLHWLTPAVRPLTAAVRAVCSVSPRLLDGNVTSAVAGALRMAGVARPELAARADAVLDALLRSGPLEGTGRRREDGSFVRRSCCLCYRLPDAGTCGDCILDARR
ncbi:(2Fe-2S)-binding protein [Blastococcus jejuensis]|uniref:(2Fe-2S)-binding protein n=1 Tax=Blastococcus jejuensis TaxID=351224 RepID=UPI0031DF0B5B